MIPYIRIPAFVDAQADFSGFRTLIVAAIIAGYILYLLRLSKFKLVSPEAKWFFVFPLFSGFLFAHLTKLAAYDLPALLANPWLSVQVYNGMSSMGGMLGGVAGGVLASYTLGIPRSRWLHYAEAGAFVLPVCWMVGRTGCALSHDHIGRPSSHWLAVAYPGGSRWNLGLIEALYMLCLSLLFLTLDRHPRPAGFFAAMFCFLYGAFRFFLDYLHAQPPGWASPDRILALLVFGCGIGIAFVVKHSTSRR